MANEKILNTRVQLKYDTLANWNASTFIPKKGEVCIATVDTAQKDPKGNIITVPTLLIKVGSGAEGATFSTLPFVSAPAADVYDWAKKSEAEFVAGFLNMKNGETTMQSLLDGVFATDAELAAAIAGIQGQIDTLAGKVSVAEGKITTLEGKVAALEAGTYDDTEVRGLIKNNKDAIDAIKDGVSIDSFKDVEDALDGKQAAGDYATNTALNAVKATAEAAYVKPAAGIAKSDLAADVQTSLGKADTALQSHQDISHLATKTEVQAGDKANSDAIGVINTTISGYGDIVTHNVAEFATAAQGAKADTALQEHQDISHLATKEEHNALAGKVTTTEGKITALEGKVDVAKVSEAISTAVADEAARADAAEKKVLEDAKAYTDEEINKITTGAGYATTKYVDDAVAAHTSAVNTKFADYSTTEQMNAVIDADVLVETNRATGAEEALAGRIKDLEDNKADYATKTDAQGYATTAKTEAISEAKSYADEIKATVLGENDKLVATYDTLSEIGQWIETSGVDATDLTTAIAAETKAREDADTAINETIAEVKATAEAAQTADEVSGAIDAKIEALDLANTYQAKGEYATAAQGALADTALQAADITAGPTYGAGENDNGSAGMDILVKGTPAASLVMTAAKDGGLKIDNQASGASHQVIGAIALTDEAKASLEKADSALQEITTTANGGLKVTNKNQIDIDDSVVFVFDCGSATENIG